MKLFLLDSTKQLAFGLSTSVTRLNLVFVCFIDGFHFFTFVNSKNVFLIIADFFWSEINFFLLTFFTYFQEPAGIVCHAFEALVEVAFY